MALHLHPLSVMKELDQYVPTDIEMLRRLLFKMQTVLEMFVQTLRNGAPESIRFCEMQREHFNSMGLIVREIRLRGFAVGRDGWTVGSMESKSGFGLLRNEEQHLAKLCTELLRDEGMDSRLECLIRTSILPVAEAHLGVLDSLVN